MRGRGCWLCARSTFTLATSAFFCSISLQRVLIIVLARPQEPPGDSACEEMNPLLFPIFNISWKVDSGGSNRKVKRTSLVRLFGGGGRGRGNPVLTFAGFATRGGGRQNFHKMGM